MIIHSIELVNFLKYETAKIEPLPDHGLIEIIGDNESGKTSLGDAVCFALYGRTSALDRENIRQCVRWGTRRASVTLEISDGKGPRHRLTRSVTEEGQTSAELLCRSSEEPVLTNPTEIADALRSIFDLKFSEYQQTIYFTQDVPPTIDSAYLSKMCGMEAIQATAADLEKLHHTAQEQDDNLSSRIATLKNELETLEERFQQLDTVRQQLLAATNDFASATVRTKDLTDLSDALQQKKTELQAAAHALDTIATNDSWDSWNVRLNQLEEQMRDLDQLLPRLGDIEPPHGLSTKLRSKIDDTRVLLSGFQSLLNLLAPRRQELDQLLTADNRETKLTTQISESATARSIAWIGAGVTGVVYLALLLFMNIFSQPLTGLAITVLAALIGTTTVVFGLKQTRIYKTLRTTLEEHQETLNKARKEVSELDKLTTLPLFRALDLLQEHPDEAIRNRAQLFAEGPGSDLTDHQRIRTHTHDIAKETEALLDRLNPTCTNLTTLIELQNRELLNLQHDKKQLEEETIELESLIRPVYEIDIEISACEEEQVSTQHRLTVLTTAKQLLNDNSEQMNRRFNQDLRKIISAMLPALTSDYYQAARIVPPFKLEVFSKEREDFVALEQLSNGTRRQILLAFRLALAEHLIKTRELGQQFIFLDEPFAFFDEKRTRKTLALLPELSAGLTQIWVTGQAFPDNTTAQLRIHCEREQTRLHTGLEKKVTPEVEETI